MKIVLKHNGHKFAEIEIAGTPESITLGQLLAKIIIQREKEHESYPRSYSFLGRALGKLDLNKTLAELHMESGSALDAGEKGVGKWTWMGLMEDLCSCEPVDIAAAQLLWRHKFKDVGSLAPGDNTRLHCKILFNLPLGTDAKILPDLKARNENGQTPLDLAVATGKGEVVKRLIAVAAAAGIAIDSIGDYATALHAVCSAPHLTQDHLQILRLLIKSGANVNARDMQHATPLICLMGHTNEFAEKMIYELIAAGADLNLLGRHPRIKLPNNINIWNSMMDVPQQGTALHFALFAQSPHYRILVAAGANLNKVIEKKGWLIKETIESYASLQLAQHPATREYLIKYGANPHLLQNPSPAALVNFDQHQLQPLYDRYWTPSLLPLLMQTLDTMPKEMLLLIVNYALGYENRVERRKEIFAIARQEALSLFDRYWAPELLPLLMKTLSFMPKDLPLLIVNYIFGHEASVEKQKGISAIVPQEGLPRFAERENGIQLAEHKLVLGNLRKAWQASGKLQPKDVEEFLLYRGLHATGQMRDRILHVVLHLLGVDRGIELLNRSVADKKSPAPLLDAKLASTALAQDGAAQDTDAPVQDVKKAGVAIDRLVEILATLIKSNNALFNIDAAALDHLSKLASPELFAYWLKGNWNQDKGRNLALLLSSNSHGLEPTEAGEIYRFLKAVLPVTLGFIPILADSKPAELLMPVERIRAPKRVLPASLLPYSPDAKIADRKTAAPAEFISVNEGMLVDTLKTLIQSNYALFKFADDEPRKEIDQVLTSNGFAAWFRKYWDKDKGDKLALMLRSRMASGSASVIGEIYNVLIKTMPAVLGITPADNKTAPAAQSGLPQTKHTTSSQSFFAGPQLKERLLAMLKLSQSDYALINALSRLTKLSELQDFYGRNKDIIFLNLQDKAVAMQKSAKAMQESESASSLPKDKKNLAEMNLLIQSHLKWLNDPMNPLNKPVVAEIKEKTTLNPPERVQFG